MIKYTIAPEFIANNIDKNSVVMNPFNEMKKQLLTICFLSISLLFFSQECDEDSFVTQHPESITVIANGIYRIPFGDINSNDQIQNSDVNILLQNIGKGGQF